MYEPPKNNLGCNRCFPTNYSLRALCVRDYVLVLYCGLRRAQILMIKLELRQFCKLTPPFI